MKKKFTTRTVGAIVTLMLLFFSSCKKEINSPAPSPTSDLRLGEVVLPPTFNFSTYTDVSLNITCEPNTTFKIKGKYGSEANLLGTYFSSSSNLSRQIEVPAFYEDLIIEAYSEKGKREMKFALNQSSTLIQSDFTGSCMSSNQSELYCLENKIDLTLN